MNGSTGAPSPAWLKRAWIEWLGPEKIWEAYGGSERIAGTLISGTEWLAHPGSVGRPSGGRKIRKAGVKLALRAGPIDRPNLPAMHHVPLPDCSKLHTIGKKIVSYPPRESKFWCCPF